jgi:hypothetical protein
MRYVEPMATDPPKPPDDAFDVVMVGGATDDGDGAHVLRARPGRVDLAEVHPLREGRPIAGGAEVVRLSPRPDAPALYDVKVEHVVPPRLGAGCGPAQVASAQYREGWDRAFARKGPDAPN